MLKGTINKKMNMELWTLLRKKMCLELKGKKKDDSECIENKGKKPVDTLWATVCPISLLLRSLDKTSYKRPKYLNNIFSNFILYFFSSDFTSNTKFLIEKLQITQKYI